MKNTTTILKNFWTSKKFINGLKHFVLVNETKENEKITFQMVSVLDSEINLKITYEDLINSGNWHEGWIDLPKIKSISEEYTKIKSQIQEEEVKKIFINDDSLFNIS